MNKLYTSITKALALGSMLTLAGSAYAQTLAITNAKIHTATAQGVIENGTVLVENGVITAINPANLSADITVDAKGAMLTPGLIAPLNVLGLTEVGAVKATADHSDEKADATFTPDLAYNHRSTLIPYSRKGGITTAVISPYGNGKSLYSGQTAVVNLSGEYDSIEQSEHALVMGVGAKSKGSRAHSMQSFKQKLEDTKKALDKAEEAKKDKKDDKDKKEAKEPSVEEKLFNAVVKGEKPLVVWAERSTDLLQLIELKKQYNLNMILAGASDAILIKEQLAQSGIPVLFNPLDNLPSSFDSLHVNLANAGILSKAGVKVMIYEADTHNLYLQRFNAGNAISYGMDKAEALKAVTANIADAFGLDNGTIEVGKPADLVLWHGDMFDINSYVVKMWIDGKEYSTESRQDKLRDRYLKKGDKPEAYYK